MDSVPSLPISGVQTLDRSVSILDALAREGPCTLADLVRATGLARPTAHRLAVALEHLALVVRDRGGRFRLGARLVGWGAAAGAALALVEPARAVLQRLSADSGESAQLYVREGDQRVCVATHERPTGLRDTVPLGAVMPLTKGSGGRVLLAWADDRDRFDVDPGVLDAVRDAGWAATVGERESGVASVSAPVRVADHVVAAISVSGPAQRFGPDPGLQFAAPVLSAAADLARTGGLPETQR
ncbi:MAG: IclR family transcriptional regulator [Acidimicrobiia bacterium]